LILTGPNAAGKTTLLKSTLVNLILSQQFGCGFFDSAHIKIYDYFHCYINIPETSNRDSLFQAEARQCKNILDIIKNNPDKNHFCVFDELYSGTNPNEATNAAIKLLNYISTNNVNFILTTHYTKICKKINKKYSKNYYMYIDKDISKNLIYTYKLKPGISKIKGAFNVLEKLNYPKEMLE
jgi:DNA mismatch repair ATPase MutS